ncbi:MAG: hypothetical protein ACYDAR_20430, partial [Thermomicrobiales bacterium]
MARLTGMVIDGSGFNRSYTYDNIGNLATVTDNLANQSQHFGYDEQDRLTTAYTVGGSAPGYSETDTYDSVGNLTSKAGVAYTYPAAGSAHPHAVTSVGGAAYQYDPNGNLTSESEFGRSYAWNADNLPTSITTTPTGGGGQGGTPSLTAPSRSGTGPAGVPNLVAPSRAGNGQAGAPGFVAPARPVNTSPVTETYTYDAAGQRVSRVAQGVTTLFFGGLWERENETGTTRALYLLNGQVIAQRETVGGAATLVYLHGDHLGSVSLVTSSSGAVVSQQEYLPWGSARSGVVSETTRNYTGQQRD